MSWGGEGRRFGLSRLSAAALVLALGVTAIGVVGIRSLQTGQEERLLKERASEIALILTQAANAIPDRLKAQGAVLGATGLSVAAYDQAAAADVTAQKGRAAFAWLRPTGTGFTVAAAQGTGLRVGQVFTGVRAAEMRRALTAGSLVPGAVLGTNRLLGFSYGPPAAPPGTVLYQESTLGPVVSPSRQADTDPFSDLDVVLYGTATEDQAQVLVGPRRKLPLTGDVARKTIPVGTASWLIIVKARRPLVGSVSASAPWFVAGAGLLASLLIGAVVESTVRRRDDAMALYDSERASAETFQRSLLPTLPTFAGLDTCARYVASGRHQQVGGDWFDVFPVAGDRIGFVIGDVMGHDLVAASAMAQVRSALRAYALDGTCPAKVLDRLNEFVLRLEVTELVTVVYGLLGPARDDGSRELTWSNAGHLPPLLRHPSGAVEPLVGAESMLIGAPSVAPHLSSSRELEQGSSLLLFTDGLVESPGSSLDDAVTALAGVVGSFSGDADGLCERVLATGGSDRDDIAVLALKIGQPRGQSPT